MDWFPRTGMTCLGNTLDESAWVSRSDKLVMVSEASSTCFGISWSRHFLLCTNQHSDSLRDDVILSRLLTLISAAFTEVKSPVICPLKKKHQSSPETSPTDNFLKKSAVVFLHKSCFILKNFPLQYIIQSFLFCTRFHLIIQIICHLQKQHKLWKVPSSLSFKKSPKINLKLS